MDILSLFPFSLRDARRILRVCWSDGQSVDERPTGHWGVLRGGR